MLHQISSRSEFHITIAHSTVVATCHFFSCPQLKLHHHAQRADALYHQSPALVPRTTQEDFDVSARYTEVQELPVDESNDKVFYTIVLIDGKKGITVSWFIIGGEVKVEEMTRSLPCGRCFYLGLQLCVCVSPGRLYRSNMV